MRRDKDCPYKSHCNSAPEGCAECDWHMAFEKLRRRIERMENRLSKANATIEMYRGVKGCRLNEMMDAELQGRCMTLPAHDCDDIEEFTELYEDFMEQIRVDPPVSPVMEIARTILEFLKSVQKAAFVRESKFREEST